MTIHGDHPFLPPETSRSAVRRLRARIGGGVTIWTTGVGRGRAGLTVSSMLVGDGDPGRVLGLVDPESALAEALADTETFVVNLLGWPDRRLADAFAGVAPAPGGVFTLGSWTDVEWGPVLDSSPAWAGCRLVAEAMRAFGWSLLVEAIIEKVELREETAEPLLHRRGRYQRPTG